MQREITELVREFHSRAIELRRDFHKFPETGWLEMRTSAIIAKELSALGYEVITGRGVCAGEARMGEPSEEELKEHAVLAKLQGAPEEFLTEDMKRGFTGVIGILKHGEGPTAAFRFDIDALPLEESSRPEHIPNREGFASANRGVMHACGHDAHAAMGLGTAYVLAHLKEHLNGTVKLIFQPAEEGVRGAKAIVEKGHLDDVDYFAGTHVAPDDGGDDGDMTPGSFGSLATAKYDIFFKGMPAHAGGYPEEGRNALMAAAHAAVGLLGISRHSKGMSRINVGVLESGTGRNVIPAEAHMKIEVRGETDEINDYMAARAREVCFGAAAMEGTECEMKLVGAAPSQVSSEVFVLLIKEMMEEYFPFYRVSSDINPKNKGSEDIGFMMNRVQEHGGQAVYMRSVTRMASPQHTAEFDLDEAVLDQGITVFSGIACKLLFTE